MLLSNAAEGKMVMCVLLCCSVLQFSSVCIFVVPSFAKFDDQVVGWRGNTCCVRTGQIFEQSRSSEETDRNVDVSTANLPSPTYAVAMSLYQINYLLCSL